MPYITYIFSLPTFSKLNTCLNLILFWLKFHQLSYFDPTLQRYGTATQKAKTPDTRTRVLCNNKQTFRFIQAIQMLHHRHKQNECNMSDKIGNKYKTGSNFRL